MSLDPMGVGMAGMTLVGRESELRTLTGWLAEALHGDSRVVLCGGEPGVGKTRREVRGRHR
ncbi:MAG: AAA family ATPase [Micromonosporaceae bacterium]